jgi:hypothetical protein
LINLPVEERSTNDESILHMYCSGYETEFTKSKFNQYLSMDEVNSAEIDLNKKIEDFKNQDYSKEIDGISSMSKQYIREYLENLFKDWYPKWEWDLRSSTPTKFIDAVSNDIVLNKLDEAMIKAFILI